MPDLRRHKKDLIKRQKEADILLQKPKQKQKKIAPRLSQKNRENIADQLGIPSTRQTEEKLAKISRENPFLDRMFTGGSNSRTPKNKGGHESSERNYDDRTAKYDSSNVDTWIGQMEGELTPEEKREWDSILANNVAKNINPAKVSMLKTPAKRYLITFKQKHPNEPFVISSAVRTHESNRGVADSDHMYGLGFDLKPPRREYADFFIDKYGRHSYVIIHGSDPHVHVSVRPNSKKISERKGTGRRYTNADVQRAMREKDILS
jgi:hypothetical protein